MRVNIVVPKGLQIKNIDKICGALPIRKTEGEDAINTQLCVIEFCETNYCSYIDHAKIQYVFSTFTHINIKV